MASASSLPYVMPIFSKLQELPLLFSTRTRPGPDLRVNNDTDKLNQFFSQSLMQFIAALRS